MSTSSSAVTPVKIGLMCYPGMGHVLPMASLGRALQRRGHSVHFIHVLDMEKPIVAAGLPFIPIGAAAQPRGTQRRLDDEVGRLTGMPVMQFTVQRQVDSAQIELDELPGILRDASPAFDLLLVDTVITGPFAVALHCRVPVFSIDLLPARVNEDSAPLFFFDWPYGSPDTDGGVARQRNWAGNQLMANMIAPVRALVDAQRVKWGLGATSSIDDQWAAPLRIGQVPAFVDFPRDAWPSGNYHHTGPWIEPAIRPKTAFPWERLNGKPLVYASMGTLTNSIASVFQTIATAFSTLDVQLILSTGGGLSHDALGSLAGSPIVVDQAPQLELLPRAALVVTHCGINTSLEALSAGKPMLCIPVGFDQPGNARRLERQGVGEIVRIHELTVDKLRVAAQKLLQDERYRQRAEQAAERIKALNGLETAVALIEQTFEQVRSRA